MDYMLPKLLSDKDAHSSIKNVPEVQRDTEPMRSIGAIPSSYLNYYYYHERLNVQAGWNNYYDSALGALLVHPLIGDYEKARDVLDAVTEANGLSLVKNAFNK